MKKLFLLMTISALVLTGCSSEQSSVSQSKVVLPAYYLAGRVQASEAADLSVPFTGRVEGVLVKVGQIVKAGDPLVQFDASDATAQSEVSKQALGIAQASLAKAKIGARPEQLLQAESALKAAQTAYDNAKNNLDRQQSLFNEGVDSAVQLEVAKGQAASAEAVLKNTSEAFEILKNGETKAYLDVLKKQVDQAQAAVKATQVALSNRVMKAPFDGMVVASAAKVGETYSAQTVLVSLENQNRMTVDAYGPASVISKFKENQKVHARMADQPDKEVSGTITWVGHTVDPKRRDVLVKISLDPEPSLMTGMLVEVAPAQ